MTDNFPAHGLQLRSLVTADGRLEVSLARVDIAAPADDEIVVRIEATPINPSDLGLLLGPADAATASVSVRDGRPVLTAVIPPKLLPMLSARVGESMPVGNEGAGTVVAAGASPGAQALMGRVVAIVGGAMYAQYRTVKAADALPLPDGATPADGASCFVNPLTALGMLETMRLEGHTALVHTAAASNLGVMLNRVCLADGVKLVNIVRSATQLAALRDIGAVHVSDSSADGFFEALTEAVSATGATLAFDAVGGGTLAGQILSAMEISASRQQAVYSRYGSSVHKQVYIYGGLDTRPTELARNYGMAWGVGGWLLTPFLQRLGRDGVQRLRQRVAGELKTTFASHYTQTLSLAEVLQPATVAACARRATGEKYLIDPSR